MYVVKLEELKTLDTDLVDNVSAKVEKCLAQNEGLAEEEFCPAYYDGLLCWDATPWNTLAVQRCFSEFHGVQYDDTRKLISNPFITPLLTIYVNNAVTWRRWIC